MNTLSKFHLAKHTNEKKIMLKQLEINAKIDKLTNMDNLLINSFKSVLSNIKTGKSDSTKSKNSSSTNSFQKGIELFESFRDLVYNFKHIYSTFRSNKN